MLFSAGLRYRKRLAAATTAACSALLIALAGAAQAVPANSKAPVTLEGAHERAAEAATSPTLSIIVSLDHQQLTLYSDAEPIALSRVSTGRPGHGTPTGVFSIIEKDRWHHSNLYEDAPMYFMQRITWSGVALHQGEVPNYPASHGCIRLPEAFAQKLWGMTRLGVRVIVTHGEAEPVAISHPHLFLPAHEQAVAARALPNPAQTVKAAFDHEVSQLRPRPDAVMFAQTTLPASSTSDSVNSVPMPTRPAPQIQLAAPLKPGPISVFISRKEGRLFVRKGFAPVFDMPVTFERPADPIGTHVFTALAVKGDRDSVQWTVVTVPEAESAKAKASGAQLTAAAALDRVTIPADALERIESLMSAGASLIITDQGLGPETGAGTDFIVLTR
jgi:L,D-transpeptidase catalytic domain